MTTTATTYQSAIEYVEALQWRGDNVTQLQEFLLPASPLIDGGGADDTARTVLIAVLDQTNMALYKSLGRQTRQAAVAVGDWVVRSLGPGVMASQDPADLQVIKAEEFERRFRPVGNVLSGPVTISQGDPNWLRATHPRLTQMAGGDGGPGTQMTTTQQADLAGER